MASTLRKLLRLATQVGKSLKLAEIKNLFYKKKTVKNQEKIGKSMDWEHQLHSKK